MPTETELKLQIDPEAIAFLEASDLLGKGGKAEKQHAVYFDTADRALHAHGMSLRIRRSGQDRIQTLKISDGPMTGLFNRAEWDLAVSNDDPAISGLDPLTKLLGDDARKLVPIFEIRNERRLWTIRQGASTMELVVDRGAAVAADRESPIHEIELELKSGQPRDLFNLARKIDAVVPVRLGISTKAERGYDLLGPARSAAKAEPVILEENATVSQAFQAIAMSCVRQYRRNEAILLQSPNPAALHQARVALRRLRSALSIFKAALNTDRAAYFSAALRSFAAILGDARNLDVLEEQPLAPEARARIAEARHAAYDQVAALLHAPHCRALFLDLVEWLSGDGHVGDAALAEAPIETFASRQLDRLWRRVGKDGRHLGKGSDEARHDVRKDAKKLRYAVEFFATLFNTPKRQGRRRNFLKRMERLQEDLGGLNDLVTADLLFDTLGIAHPAFADRDRMIGSAVKSWDGLVHVKRFWKKPAPVRHQSMA